MAEWKGRCFPSVLKQLHVLILIYNTRLNLHISGSETRIESDGIVLHERIRFVLCVTGLCWKKMKKNDKKMIFLHLESSANIKA